MTALHGNTSVPQHFGYISVGQNFSVGKMELQRFGALAPGDLGMGIQPYAYAIIRTPGAQVHGFPRTGSPDSNMSNAYDADS